MMLRRSENQALGVPGAIVHHRAGVCGRPQAQAAAGCIIAARHSHASHLFFVDI